MHFGIWGRFCFAIFAVSLRIDSSLEKWVAIGLWAEILPFGEFTYLLEDFFALRRNCITLHVLVRNLSY